MTKNSNTNEQQLTNHEQQGENDEQEKKFSFDRRFQEKIVQAMIEDRQWASQFNEVLDINYFQYNYLKLVSQKYLGYYGQYKEFPSLELLTNLVAQELKTDRDKLLKDQAKEFLSRVADRENLGDLPHVKEKALDFCKRAALQKALFESAEMIDSPENYEKIVDVVKNAIAVGNHHSPGLDLFEDVTARYSETFRKTVPTGIQELDQKKVLNGGLGAGELGVVVAPTGCHKRGTKILMYDGSLKAVEDVEVGDKLMGPDSTPREVRRLIRGKQQMYRITPNRGGEPFEVNEDHILSLKRTKCGKGKSPNKDGKIVNLSVRDYLESSKTFKHTHKLWRTPVYFNDTSILKDDDIPPYILGLFLGDGFLNKKRIEITTADKPIVEALRKYGLDEGCDLTKHSKNGSEASGYYYTNNKKHNNPIISRLKEINLLGTDSSNKFIPERYKTATKQQRTELLAGLLDSDGYITNNCLDFVQQSKQLAEDFAFVARSLGLQATLKTKTINENYYYRVFVSGQTDMIPSRLVRKTCKPRKQKKDVLVTGFDIAATGVDDYFGFQLSGDHLYLLGDFTVTHNSGKSHVLVHVGAQAIKNNLNVLHYTFELNERAVGIRYDSHLYDTPSLDCYDHQEEIADFYKQNADDLGRLLVKYYPTNSATSMMLRGHIEKLESKDFKPDLVIVDYAGIMRSSDRYELLRMELKKVMEELRALSTELDVPVWTAIQSNKEGAQNDVVDLTNMAEGYGQAHVADFVIGLARKSAQKATGFGNVFVAKNRVGIDGIKYQVHLDTSKSKLRILTDAEVQEVSEQLEEGEHDFVRKKLREMQQKKESNSTS